MFTVMAEETADVAYIEQLVICMRLIDDQLTTQEEIFLFRTYKCWVNILILKLLAKCDNK